MGLVYHEGQRAVQDEASTRMIADKLADWVGPISELARVADLLLFATAGADRVPRFTIVSGPAPLVDTARDGVLAVPALRVDGPAPCGGLAIHLGQARRVRVNGTLAPGAAGAELALAERFTLCRKYMAPSVVVGDAPTVGPAAREPIALDDAWLAELVARADTAFLATVAPSGLPDVAHRGGPPGFVALAPGGALRWPEYVGDGVFKSAGNLRATGVMTLLVPDFATGDAVELSGRGDYVNERAERKGQRQNVLVQFKDPFPLQGRVACTIDAAVRLRGAMLPRRAIEKLKRVTSCEAPEEQAPR